MCLLRVQLVEDLQIREIVQFAVQPTLHVLLQLQLVDVQHELQHDLLGIVEHLLDDVVVVLAQHEDVPEHVLTREATLQEKAVTKLTGRTIENARTAWLSSMKASMQRG